ncbi:hypothetical protein E2C01_058799 [Portunus trituberculatus]|uniref:Uncharacterized protein n=1 Tax=Portunus trituberculatus TaxID=210409 RepID=A0A5B7H479_PORTR|nr:hypothetical protein [Portunus trituberculatus]
MGRGHEQELAAAQPGKRLTWPRLPASVAPPETIEVAAWRRRPSRSASGAARFLATKINISVGGGRGGDGGTKGGGRRARRTAMPVSG